MGDFLRKGWCYFICLRFWWLYYIITIWPAAGEIATLLCYVIFLCYLVEAHQFVSVNCCVVLSYMDAQLKGHVPLKKARRIENRVALLGASYPEIYLWKKYICVRIMLFIFQMVMNMPSLLPRLLWMEMCFTARTIYRTPAGRTPSFVLWMAQ